MLDLILIKSKYRIEYIFFADDIFDEMVSRNVGEYRYPLGGKLYVFNKNENIGFIKGHMCSPAIATQAEDLIARG